MAAAIRRVRDAGKRWWCCLIPLYSLILFCSKIDDKQSRKQAKGRGAFGVILALVTIGVITYKVFKTDAFDTSLSSAIGELKELFAGNGKEASDVPQDYVQAFNLVKQVADMGYADAQYCLGVWYYNGGVVEQDKDKAVEYFRLAVAGGNGDAAEWLKSLEDNASTGQAAGADNGQDDAAEAEGEMGLYMTDNPLSLYTEAPSPTISNHGHIPSLDTDHRSSHRTMPPP